MFRDWKPKGRGNVEMRHAIMQSCDVYFYTVASKLGIDRMHEFMSIFGFGEVTGIDIPGEKPGLMPSTDWKRHAYKRTAEQVWFPGDKPRLVTAVRAAGTPYKIAGETGSAQVFNHALFISFAPADDPKLAVAVFVENGKHGGSTAAPIARKMFDAYLLPDKASLADNLSAPGTPL